MKQENPYIHRDLSWLSFNYRVLQEAKDPNVPLFERIKFLAIYSSNLDEFFRVRVANLKNLIKVGKKTQKSLQFEPQEIFRKILRTVNAQQEEFSDIFQNMIIPKLSDHKINIKTQKDLSQKQFEFIENYFQDNLLPFVQPMMLIQKKVKPFLNNGSLYLALILQDKDKSKIRTAYALVKVPSDLVERFIELPTENKNKHDVILLDDIIRYNQKFIFPGYDILDSYSIKLTRDAELYIEDEFTGDLVSKIKKSLSKRSVGPASRMVYDREMPTELIEYLSDVFELNKNDLLPEGRYHNNADFFEFPKFGKKHLRDIDLPTITPKELLKGSIFDRMDERDHCIYVPYHSYEPVIQFFEQAAEDPNVTHIKIIQYRVAKKSRIMNALIKAVKNGKQVSTFIEIKARFDEEANLAWGERLEAEGIQVFYSMPGLKVHSKMATIRRYKYGQPKLYSYFSTGNFHEDTAKLYTDIGLFTSDENLVNESMRLFSYLETKYVPEKKFEHLGVGKFNLKPKLIDLLNQEIENAKDGFKAAITLKMNSLQDKEMIDLLYKASNAGVKVKLIIRGICSLVPGIEGISEKISAWSIVDRFLEHPRIFIFHNKGKEKIYISSADWMVRNLHHRIETMVPVYDENIKKFILNIINIQNLDNVKSRRIHYKKNNSYRKTKSDLPIRSQLETYYFIKRMEEGIN